MTNEALQNFHRDMLVLFGAKWTDALREVEQRNPEGVQRLKALMQPDVLVSPANPRAN
jgi:hypothetical protein